MNTVAKAEHPIVVLRTYLDQRHKELKAALPAHITPEKFVRTVITAAQINPDIAACDKLSLWNAVMRACNDGLLPDGIEGAIVPFKSRATWIPMYQGLLKLFRNSGQFKHINSGLVYQGEEFQHWIDETGEHFRHVPGEARDPAAIRRVYATATTKDGGFFLVDLTIAEINKHKAQSRASRDDAPWKQWPEAMMRKTALRVLSKLLPKSSDLEEVMHKDELGELEGARAPLTPHGESLMLAADASIGDRLDQFAELRGESVATAQQDRGAGPTESAVEAGAPVDPIVAAYKRGVEAKAAGHTRRAVPGEYREPIKADEYNAWLSGWDGKPPPGEPTSEQPDMLGGAA